MTRRVRDNPFHVLGVAPDAPRVAIEAEGQKLLAMLELGLDGADRYQTPLGPATRTAQDVRRALGELRDPEKRLEHELWARLTAPREVAPRPRPPALPGLRRRMGW